MNFKVIWLYVEYQGLIEPDIKRSLKLEHNSLFKRVF